MRVHERKLETGEVQIEAEMTPEDYKLWMKIKRARPGKTNAELLLEAYRVLVEKLESEEHGEDESSTSG